MGKTIFKRILDKEDVKMQVEQVKLGWSLMVDFCGCSELIVIYRIS
jgi:hypothetical protein